MCFVRAELAGVSWTTLIPAAALELPEHVVLVTSARPLVTSQLRHRAPEDLEKSRRSSDDEARPGNAGRGHRCRRPAAPLEPTLPIPALRSFDRSAWGSHHRLSLSAY